MPKTPPLLLCWARAPARSSNPMFSRSIESTPSVSSANGHLISSSPGSPPIAIGSASSVIAKHPLSYQTPQIDSDSSANILLVVPQGIGHPAHVFAVQHHVERIHQ